MTEHLEDRGGCGSTTSIVAVLSYQCNQAAAEVLEMKDAYCGAAGASSTDSGTSGAYKRSVGLMGLVDRTLKTDLKARQPTW